MSPGKGKRALTDLNEVVRLKNMHGYVLRRLQDGTVEIVDPTKKWRVELRTADEVLELIEALAWVIKR